MKRSGQCSWLDTRCVRASSLACRPCTSPKCMPMLSWALHAFRGWPGSWLHLALLPPRNQSWPRLVLLLLLCGQAAGLQFLVAVIPITHILRRSKSRQNAHPHACKRASPGSKGAIASMCVPLADMSVAAVAFCLSRAATGNNRNADGAPQRPREDGHDRDQGDQELCGPGAVG